MEIFDVYSRDHEKTGRSIFRGTPLTDGEYGLVVHVWIKNSDGEYIITKRARHKSFGGLWECPGGGALAGETSLEAALREVKEEIGITLDPHKGRIIKFCVYEAIRMICDVWLFSQDINVQSFILQAEEVSDIRVVKLEEIIALNDSGNFVPVYGYLDWLSDSDKNAIF